MVTNLKMHAKELWEDFRNEKVRVLVATDIAARGIDIDGITHVINFELPHIPESYVHRIGRTARAGASGQSISFCTAEERSFLFAIEKVTRQPVTVLTDHPFHSEDIANAQVMSAGKAKAILEGQRLQNRAKNRPQRHGGGGGEGKSGKKPFRSGPFRGHGKTASQSLPPKNHTNSFLVSLGLPNGSQGRNRNNAAIEFRDFAFQIVDLRINIT